jgi:hypothetical protein
MAYGASRDSYVYKDDAGNNWIIKIASDRVAGVTPATGLSIYNSASPPTPAPVGVLNPKRCRRVYAQAVTTEGSAASRLVKRQFICNPTSALYTSNTSQVVTYVAEDEGSASINMNTTGRRGERITF